MPLLPQDPNWENKVRDSFSRQTFPQLIGAEIEDLQPGELSLRVRRRPELCQQHGLLHGGVTATLADTASGYAAYSLAPAGSTVLTAEFKLNLVAAAKGNDFIARAAVVKPGRTLIVVSCDVYARGDEGESQIAVFLGTMMILNGRSDRE